MHIWQGNNAEVIDAGGVSTKSLDTFTSTMCHIFLTEHNDLFCCSNGCMFLLSIETTPHYFNIIRKFVQAIVRISLMFGLFPRKLNPVFLLVLTNKELKFPDNFIPKLKSPIPRS